MIKESTQEVYTENSNKLQTEFPKQVQIEMINEVILGIAEGNFNLVAPVSDDLDEIDAIASGINMLCEELRDTVISRNYLDSVLRSTVDMLFIFDDNFIIKQITPKVCHLLKQPETHFIGEPISILFDGRKKRFIQRLKEDLNTEGKLPKIDSVFKTSGRGKLPVILSLFALKNNRNLISGYLMVAEDVREKLDTSSALKRRNDELKTLIYRTYHDLKGPLASMLGLFSVMEQEKQDLSTLQIYLTHLKSSAEKLNTTLSELLEIGVVDQADPTMKKLGLKKIIQDVVESLSNYPGREDVDIKIFVDDDLVISSNEKLICSVLQNLIENSIKYRKYNSRDSSFIKIFARVQKDKMVICVKDNGQGMDKNVLKRAFDMFYRGNQDSKGSGLGLFIVKSNVEKLKGEIKVRSKANEGTETKISLPFTL